MVGWHHQLNSHSVQFCTITQSCLTLCNPLDCSMPGFKLMPTESGMPSNHLILCCLLLLLPSIFPSIRVSSNESALHIRWSKYWSFSFNISPSNEYSGLISFRMDWLDLPSVKVLSRVFSKSQFKSINSLVFSFIHSLTLTSIHDHWKNHSLD